MGTSLSRQDNYHFSHSHALKKNSALILLLAHKETTQHFLCARFELDGIACVR